MGLPVKQFIAATNVNDTVPRFLDTGVYETRPSIQTYANAMDVGAPSNWVRIMDLFGNDQEAVKNIVKSYSFTDEETLQAIKDLYEKFSYVACPHTAIAWLALQSYTKETIEKGNNLVFLSTAHACKFPDIFPDDIKAKIEIPEQVNSLFSKEKKATAMDTSFESFKKYLNSY